MDKLPRLPRAMLVVAVSVAGLVALGGYAVWSTRTGPPVPPMTISESGTVIESQRLDVPIEIKADNVVVRRSEIDTHGATAAIIVHPGFRGTTIEDTKIRCQSRQMDGVVVGGYTARRVRVHGCRSPFVFTVDAPAKIEDSYWNDKPYTPGEPAAVALPSAEAPPSGFGRFAASPTPRGAPTRSSPWPPVTLPAGYPGAQNTGVPAGTALTASGSLTLTTNGQVLSGLDITGCVDVKAQNVTIKKSRITCSRTTFAVRTHSEAENLVVEDAEISGSGNTSAVVCCGDYTLRRVNIHDTIDGPRLGSNTTVVDSWIHDLTRVDGSHGDTLQTTGAANIVVRHNRLEPYNAKTDDPNNAAIMIGSTTAPEVRNMLIEDNYCDGGNYTIGIRGDMTAINIVFRRNAFGRNHRYGVVANYDQPGVTWEDSNVYLDTRAPVVD